MPLILAVPLCFAAYLACWRLIMAGNAWTFRRRGERRLAP